MKNLRKVSIVGRMNVGKSTLFNRLSTSVKSITLDYPGVTRDVLSDTVVWKDQSFELVDTGGIVLDKTLDAIDAAVSQRARDMIAQSDLIILVVDGSVGITLEDQRIVKELHAMDVPVLVAVNKMDKSLAQDRLYEFYQLGYKQLYDISAEHGRNIETLLDAIVNTLKELPPAVERVQPQFKVVLLGKPNVGKSSLMNALLDQERSLVMDQPGTTREAISESISFYKETIALIDTPGVRRKRGVTQDLEKLMVKSTMQAVRDADIVLLLVDAAAGVLSDQELKLAFYAFEQGKALIVLFNKQDLATDDTQEQLDRNVDEYKFFLKKVAQLDISCKSGKNIGRVLPLIIKVWERHSTQFSRQEITELFKNWLLARPLYHNKMRLILNSVEQVKTAPITILFKVNEPTWFGDSQLGFFENLLRKKYNLVGAPIKFLVRKKKRK